MSVQTATDQDFQDQLKNNPKVLIKYYADWCGSCRLIAPKIKRWSDEDRFQGITFLDVNAEKNPQARKFAGVTNLPFFAVVKDGQLVGAECTSKEDKIIELINKLNA